MTMFLKELYSLRFAKNCFVTLGKLSLIENEMYVIENFWYWKKTISLCE